ncbi:MAG: (2Fe-2S) ferredoxin domain-containing protein [Leptolyngbyaceae cyanobacterium SL_1_1]|nr:(2Fe-2S) ferredoxin domain-containing protein [Leptolyngbyaceae cyanobacterium RM2_2_21]NJN01023.1 (2Fe-2S) ferredoxin domain-containing protein [Leptolyngbyaceae cyanobacterium RM1_1_2]NJO10211.1 (2Fe-2S) ferredoxin domain-containing protein [Leptolyngbyaceae cyanobacterium SL_1_1]
MECNQTAYVALCQLDRTLKTLLGENIHTMIPIDEIASAPGTRSLLSQNHVLKGQFISVFRSYKGKLKGFVLRSGGQEYTIELPKYLQPMLVRELAPGDFVQIWACSEAGSWRAINILPLAAAEVLKLQRVDQTTPVQQCFGPFKNMNVCIQVCSKGKCYRQGSSDIWRSLQAQIEANPDFQHISVESTGCMKACQQGPNLRVLPSGRIFNHVNQSTAKSLLFEQQECLGENSAFCSKERGVES